MVHPSELLRTNSNEGRGFSAPANIIDENTIDCGIKNLPCFNHCVDLEKFAIPRVFIAILTTVGFLQGVTLTYFRGTSQIWSTHYNIHQDNVDWLIYTNELFVGIFALTVAYWGFRIHRMAWIGGLTVLHSIVSLTLLAPEIYRRSAIDDNKATEPNLCFANNTTDASEDFEVNYVAVAILVIYQIFFALASISFTAHGITYLDDNTPLKYGPAYIGIALAGKELGKQAGIYSTGLPFLLHINDIFVSPAWICFSILTFIAGMVIAMFPRNLPSIIMEEVAASIVDLASGHQVIAKKESVDGFFKILFRLLKNKTLMFNIFCVVFMQSALVNFNIFEKFFNQSRFHVSDKADSLLIQLTTNLLKQPLVAISTIAVGMVIAKTEPNLKSLVKWNILVLVLVTLFFASSAFLKCDRELETEYEGLLSSPYCMSHCNCSYDAFQPVCVNKKTFFSPCFAGCTAIKEINSEKIYQNCTCGDKWFRKSNHEGTEGSCNAEKCNLFWTLSQANNVISTAFLATTFVTNLVINMKCVRKCDKAVALGLEATFVGIIPYLPVKAIYAAVAEKFCQYHGKGSCVLYSENFGLFLSSSTVGLMLISTVLAVIVLIVLKLENNDTGENDNNSGDDVNEMYSVSENQTQIEERRNLMFTAADARTSEELDLSLADDERANSRLSNATADSLREEMASVGDDHDSFTSASNRNSSNDNLSQSHRHQYLFTLNN